MWRRLLEIQVNKKRYIQKLYCIAIYIKVNTSNAGSQWIIMTFRWQIDRYNITQVCIYIYINNQNLYSSVKSFHKYNNVRDSLNKIMEWSLYLEQVFLSVFLTRMQWHLFWKFTLNETSYHWVNFRSPMKKRKFQSKYRKSWRSFNIQYLYEFLKWRWITLLGGGGNFSIGNK